MDYEEIVNKLRHDFGLPDIFTKKDGDTDHTLHVGTTLWHGTANILRVELRLEGVFPLEGNAFNQIFGAITPGMKSVDTPIGKLHGGYVVHFDAVFTDMHKVADALPPIPQTFSNPDSQPKIRWNTAAEKGGWTKLTVFMNCPLRANGKLWIQNGSMQRLPRFTGNTLVCYVPFDCASAQLLCMDGEGIRIEKQ